MFSMSEIATGDQSVTAQGASVTPQPVAQPATDTSEVDALRKKLDLALQDRAEAGATNQKLNERLKETEKSLKSLESQFHSGKQQQLQDAGDYKSLWEELKQTAANKDKEIEALKGQIESVTLSAQQERLRASSVSSISKAGVIAPEQMYALLQSQLREVNGKPVVLAGGAEQPLDGYLANLKAPGSGFEHHFAPSGARGMGAAANASVAPGLANPYKSRNLTEVLRLEKENPELASALRSEAGMG
jgi:hypothetical protein